MKAVSIVIPAYNSKELLVTHLPHVLSAIEKDHLTYEIIVVDDGSKETLSLNFPKTSVFRLPQNSGFAHACNFGAKKSRFDNIFFLNADVEITAGSLIPLIDHLKDPRVFAVSPQILIPGENNYNEALTAARLRGSNIIFKIGEIKSSLSQPIEILYACGAALMVDRNKFFEIGGFDEIYSPFYWEDFDLSYQAWKRGYRVIYEPGSIVYHMHSKTIKTFCRKSYIEGISMRNRYLFRWKNFTDPWLVFLMILELFTLKLLNPNPTEWIGFIKALKRLREVLDRRKQTRPFLKLTDRQVFEKFKDKL